LLANLPSYRNPNDPNGFRDTSCNQDNLAQDPTQAGETRNGSAYWIPSAYVCNGTTSTQQAECDSDKANFEDPSASNHWATIKPNYVQIYYRNNTHDVHESFPTGLKMIAGPMWRADEPDDQTYQNDESSTWKCFDGYLYTRDPANPDKGSGNHVPHCDSPHDYSVALQIVFPDCWDGIRLDSEYDLFGNGLIGSHDPTHIVDPMHVHRDPLSGAGYAHRDHIRRNCSDFTHDEKVQIGKDLGYTDGREGLLRQMNTLILEVRYDPTYTLNSGTPQTVAKDQTYWWALASRSEAPADQCATGVPPQTYPKKECWTQGYPECPAQYARNPRQPLPITCSGPTDNNGGPPVTPKHLVDSTHADYFFGWDPLRLDFLTHECLSSNPECKGNEVGFGMPPAGPDCSDGFDNDGDGKVDWKADGTGDPDCTSPADNTERPASDGRKLYVAVTPTHVQSGHLARISWSAENIPINVGCQGYSPTDPDWQTRPIFVNSNQDVVGPGTYTITCDICDKDGVPYDKDHCPVDPLPPLVQTVTVTQDGGGGGDTTPPTVSMTAPANGATVHNSVTVTADASDNVGVVGVQFKVDGNNIGTEDANSPYSRNWDTTSTSDGTHTLTAVARDAAGNTTASGPITVTVNNGASVTGDINGDGHVNVLDLSILLSKLGSTDPACDLNHDGQVNRADLTILLNHYGT
jgi:hypothetical protein